MGLLRKNRAKANIVFKKLLEKMETANAKTFVPFILIDRNSVKKDLRQAKGYIKELI